MDVLRISPRYTTKDWKTLDPYSPKDWGVAAAIVRDRLDGRFLRFASNCLRAKNSEFVVLSIDSLLAESIQQFKLGITDGKGMSRQMITKFLGGSRFQPYFDADARTFFYNDIRCGLLHQAEANKMWLLRRNQPDMLQKVAGSYGFMYIIDVKRFHSAVRASLNDYLKQISDPSESDLRSNLWTKMDHICDVRANRGTYYGL
jgi:hypothetical protein